MIACSNCGMNQCCGTCIGEIQGYKYAIGCPYFIAIDVGNDDKNKEKKNNGR